MNASTRPVATFSTTFVARDSVTAAASQVLERAEAPGDGQIDRHHDDRHERIGRGERQVAERRVFLDHIADELRVRNEVGGGVMWAPGGTNNGKMEPATSEGRTSGSTTRRNVVQALPPMSDEASRSEF